MDKKTKSFALALIPAIAAVGIMYKMSQDHQFALSEKQNSIKSLEMSLQSQIEKIDSVNQLCESNVSCPDLIINRFEEMKARIDSLSTAITIKNDEIKSLNTFNEGKVNDINELEAELRKINDTLRVTRQTVDAQISVELEQVEEQIDSIRQDYEKVIAELQSHLNSVRSDAKNKIQDKEQKFRELHKKSINNLLGMVDSLAQERESRIIPLISTYDDTSVKSRFICSEGAALSPTEMIFSKHMERHWLTWPVKVITNTQSELKAETAAGYSLNVTWENSDNMYELSPGDDITIQFQPSKDQACNRAISGQRAVFTTH